MAGRFDILTGGAKPTPNDKLIEDEMLFLGKAYAKTVRGKSGPALRDALTQFARDLEQLHSNSQITADAYGQMLQKALNMISTSASFEVRQANGMDVAHAMEQLRDITSLHSATRESRRSRRAGCGSDRGDEASCGSEQANRRGSC